MTKAQAAVLIYNTPNLAVSIHNQMAPSSVYIVDNGSNIDQYTNGWINWIGPYMRLDENLYFSGGWNAFMKTVPVDDIWVWMLNSDVEDVSHYMLKELHELACILPDCSIISPTFNSPHPHMQPQQKRERRLVKWIDWTAPLVKASAFLEVGGFDEDFKGYGADLDICKRLAQKGHKFYVSDLHVINHLGSLTAHQENVTIQNDVGEMNRLLKIKHGVSDWTQMFP